MIKKSDPSDWPELIDVWEASVRATHHFLHPDDITFYRKRIYNEYFTAVQLYHAGDENGQIVGFLGVYEDVLEMLFIRPDKRGRGIGRELTEFALFVLNARKVDVNEENEQAIGFYRTMGYTATGRSAVDSSNKKYPLIHMEYKEK